MVCMIIFAKAEWTVRMEMMGMTRIAVSAKQWAQPGMDVSCILYLNSWPWYDRGFGSMTDFDLMPHGVFIFHLWSPGQCIVLNNRNEWAFPPIQFCKQITLADNRIQVKGWDCTCLWGFYNTEKFMLTQFLHPRCPEATTRSSSRPLLTSNYTVTPMQRTTVMVAKLYQAPTFKH